MIQKIKISKTRLRDRGWDRILKETNLLMSKEVQAGIFDGQSENARDDLVARGVYNIIDKDGADKRNFMKVGFDENVEWLHNYIMYLKRSMVDGRISHATMLKRIALRLSNHIKDAIVKGNYKALSDYTIKKKKSSTPLIDTGMMKNSITGKVVDKKQ